LGPQGRPGDQKESDEDHANPTAFFDFHVPSNERIFPLQPAFRRGFIALGIDALRPQDAACEGDHAWDVDSDRAITPATEHTVSPYDPFDFV